MYAKTCYVSKWNVRARLEYFYNRTVWLRHTWAALPRALSSQPEDTRAVTEATTLKWKVRKIKISLFYFEVYIAPLLNMLKKINCYLNSSHISICIHALFFKRGSAELRIPTGENTHQASFMIYLLFHPQYHKHRSAWPFVFFIYWIIFGL